LPAILTGSREAFGCARAASSMPQLQKAIPDAAAPCKKCLRVVISSLTWRFKSAFPTAAL
jgi:hypothetical protein